MRKLIQQLKASAEFSSLDIHFASFMCQQAQHESLELFLGALVASQQTAAKNACAYLPNLAGIPVFEDSPEYCFPDLKSWRQALIESSVVGEPDTITPLILDSQGRLYLYRYWQYEQELAKAIADRLNITPEIDIEKLKDGLQKFFPKTAETNWQQLAATSAVLNGFTLITGGPGTGKTTTVVKILALLLEQGDYQIKLAAPTGKAAARLKESIKNNKATLACSDAIKARIPNEAYTLHRLLGYQSGSVYFRHNEDSPLPDDVIVVDEASMIDLALMTKLFKAVSPKARLILLGDKDQLASVESGSVLGDICLSASPNCLTTDRLRQLNHLTEQTLDFATSDRPLENSVIFLQTSYRFKDTSGIGNLAKAVNTGETESAMTLLKSENIPDISWKYFETPVRFIPPLKEKILTHLEKYLTATNPESALEAFNQFRVLCALRKGPLGVEGMNQSIEQILLKAKYIPAIKNHYHRCPIMITTNAYLLNLFNGDIGVIWETDTQLRAYFILPDGRLKSFIPSRLPHYEKAWAMTVHKSQGSEFEHVLLILAAQINRVLTRELVYTGITRAKQTVEIWGSGDILKQTIQQKVQRISGLGDRLLRN